MNSNLIIMITFFVKVENVRRKHNYLPLIVEILKVLGQEGKLVALVEKVGLTTTNHEMLGQAGLFLNGTVGLIST